MPDLLPVISSVAPRISSLLIKPVSAICNLDCAYCFYLDRASDPYQALPGRRMSDETMERLIDSYLFYSWPASIFVFQGGEPTLAGPGFYERLCALQAKHGRSGQTISNSMQTNGVLLDDRWCALFREYGWLIGISIDGPEDRHDAYRVDKGGTGTWRTVMKGIETLQRNRVPFNALCVLSRSNVSDPRGLYRFFRSLGVEYLQYIPLAEFGPDGKPLPFAITAEQYGCFLTETFDLWWPDRHRIKIRFFENVAEALAGRKPSACTMHESCDSYAVVEYNGDIYPCDFFVEGGWKLGNLHLDSWPEIARRRARLEFASKKSVPHTECAVCEYARICHGGCPHLRRSPHGRFEDLDYFCAAYKQIFARAVDPIMREIARAPHGPVAKKR